MSGENIKRKGGMQINSAKDLNVYKKAEND